MDDAKFATWAIVEIMGHSRFAGYVSEQAVGGCNFVRVDVPETCGRPAFTKLFGQASIFSITPTTEIVARAVCAQILARPLSVFDLPKIAAPSDGEQTDDGDDGMDDYISDE